MVLIVKGTQGVGLINTTFFVARMLKPAQVLHVGKVGEVGGMEIVIMGKVFRACGTEAPCSLAVSVDGLVSVWGQPHLRPQVCLMILLSLLRIFSRVCYSLLLTHPCFLPLSSLFMHLA